MPMLGEILAAARRESAGFERWLAARDPEMTRSLAEAAQEDGGSVAAYVRAAVADFSRFASEEDWAHLTSRLRDSDDPGTACLATMVQWSLDRLAEHRSHQPHGAEP